MVLFNGTKRILESPVMETSDDASTRTAEVYGITSYDELLHKVIHILSNAHGTSATCTMNINNLGAKSLKTYRNGVKVDLFDGWIAINQIYAICYDGTDFLVSHINPKEQDNTVEIYHTNSRILDLDNTSTSEEITEAFEGEDNIAEFQEALSTKQHIIIDISNSLGTGDYNCCYQFTGLLTPESASIVDIISYIDTSTNKLITMTFTRGEGNVYTSVTKTELNLENEPQPASSIADMPEQISAWALGDGTSYPPATPSETTLTEYMTSDIISKLENYVNNGTIIRAAGILSGADRKSIYTNLYVVNKNYSATESLDYEYYFKNIVGSVDFYIYWDNSELKWYWNQRGLMTGEVCFAEGTQILTPNGKTNIEDLNVGDNVISYNFETKETEIKPITKIYSHSECFIYTVKTRFDEIKVTGDHPFYVIDKGAVEARNLSAVDYFMTDDGIEVKVSEVYHEILPEDTSVYEIVVADNNNYFVGNSSVLVYNEPCVVKTEEE